MSFALALAFTHSRHVYAARSTRSTNDVLLPTHSSLHLHTTYTHAYIIFIHICIPNIRTVTLHTRARTYARLYHTMDPGEAKSLSTQLKETMHLKGFKMEKPGRRGRRLERKHTFLKRHETLVRALLCAVCIGIGELDCQTPSRLR